MLLEKIELEEGEVVLATVRKHWFVIFLQIFGVLSLSVVPLLLIVLIAFLPEQLNMLTRVTHATNILTYGIAFWMLSLALTGFNTWTQYFLDVWLITDRRVIIIFQEAVFRRRILNFRLERMQDIEVEISGIIATFLDYGTIRAQTASASDDDFSSSGLPHPRELQSLIQSAMDKRLNILRHHTEGL